MYRFPFPGGYAVRFEGCTGFKTATVGGAFVFFQLSPKSHRMWKCGELKVYVYLSTGASNKQTKIYILYIRV